MLFKYERKQSVVNRRSDPTEITVHTFSLNHTVFTVEITEMFGEVIVRVYYSAMKHIFISSAINSWAHKPFLRLFDYLEQRHEVLGF